MEGVGEAGGGCLNSAKRSDLGRRSSAEGDGSAARRRGIESTAAPARVVFWKIRRATRVELSWFARRARSTNGHSRRTGGRARSSWMPEGLSSSRSGEYIWLMAVSSPDLKAFLVATPFFGGLSDASLDLLISMLVERRFDVGATVVGEGEPGRSMYIIHSGELVVSKAGKWGARFP